MVAIKTLSLLAAAGVAIAAPANQAGSALEARGYGSPRNFGYNYKWNDDSSDDNTSPSQTEGGKKPNVVVENKDVYVTEYVTVPFGQKPPTQPTQAPPAPQPTKPSGGQSEEPKTWQDAPVQSAPSAPEAPSTGAGTGYLAIVNEYRAKMGLPNIASDSKLESNARDTSVSSGGKLVHKLNPGSMGQVMAPGANNLEKFKHVFVGGWLCEIPSLIPGGECAEQSKGWNYQGQTGHAKLLSDKKYTKIGCASESEMWTCDLA